MTNVNNIEKLNTVKQRVWFNTWFSAISITLQEIKKTFPNITLIGTNKNEDCVYQKDCDEFYVEPTGDVFKYIDFAVEFCKEHKIDVFIPKAYAEAISYNIDRFNEIGVKVLVEDAEVIKTFDSKAFAYETLAYMGYDKIPEYTIVNSADEFMEAYKKYTAQREVVCLKYDKDEGAASFRVVHDQFLTAKYLSGESNNIITSANMMTVLRDMEDKGVFKPIMVMPKLAGPEASVDCYYSEHKGLVAIPRYKLGNRIKKVELTHDLIDDCIWLQDNFGFKGVYNAQYRWDKNGKPKLLEVNTRMSGGIHLTSLCGYSIPLQALADILGVGDALAQQWEDVRNCRMTQYETPFLLSIDE